MVSLHSECNYRPFTSCSLVDLSKERNRLEKSLDDAHAKNTASAYDIQNMRDYVLQQEEDKKRLSQRIEKLSANESALVKELSRIGRHKGAVSGSTGIERGGILEEHLLGIETDRDYWRDQVEFLQKMLHNSALSSRGITSSPNPAISSKVRNKPPTGRTLSAGLRSGTTLKQQQQQQKKLEQQLHELATDRDHLKQELERLKRNQLRSPSPMNRSRSLSRTQGCENTLELSRLKNERDDLRRLLDNLEQRVQEIQRNVHTLTSERDQLNKLYGDARYEINRLQQDLCEVQHSGDRHNHTSLRRAESDRDRALVDLSRVTTERDCLISKYKKSTDQADEDKLRLSKQLDQSERNLSQVSAERDDLVRRVSDLRQCVEGAHVRQRQLEDILSEKHDQLKKSVEENERLRGELDKRMNIVNDQMNKVQHMNDLMNKIDEENLNLREKLEESMNRLSQEQCHSSGLHEEINQLEKEVHNLQFDKGELLKKQRQTEKRIQCLVYDNEQQAMQIKEASDNACRLENVIQYTERDYADQKSRYQVEKATNERLSEKHDALLQAKLVAERRVSWLDQQLTECQSNLTQAEYHLNSEQEQVRCLTESNNQIIEDNKTLRATVDLANSDKLHLESCIEEMRMAQRQAKRDYEELDKHCCSLREKLAQATNSGQQTENEVKRVAEALRSERSIVADLHQQLDMSNRRADNSEREAVDLNQRLRESEDQLHKTQSTVVHLERELRLGGEDYAQLRGRIEAAEEEKQILETNLRETNQRLSQADADLSVRAREIGELRMANEDNTRVIKHMQETLNSKHSELQSARIELSALQHTLSEIRSLKESEERERSRLNEEFIKVSRDNQILMTKLQDANDDKEEQVRRCKDYLNDLSRQERVAGERDSECRNLMDKLRCASEEAESWRARWESAENKATMARCELDDRELDLSAEREKADARERELAQLKTHLNSLEMQNTTVSRNATELNEQLKMARVELDTVGAEVTRLRDALSRIETERSTAQREVSNSRLESDQLRAQLDDLELEVEQQKQLIDKERSNSRSLQASLQTARQKEQTSVLEVQEKNNEISALKERLTTVEEKAETVIRESERLRERLSEADQEVSRLGRCLSTERFEKERALSELRLSSLPAGYRPSGYTSYSGGVAAPARERSSYREEY